MGVWRQCICASTAPQAPDARADICAFFGFVPPATLRFDDSEQGGLKVRYMRVKLPVAPSDKASDDATESVRAVASA